MHDGPILPVIGSEPTTMGNVPSKEPQGRPAHKLSKPRAVSSSSTNTNNTTTAAAATLLPSPSNGLDANPFHAPDKSHHLITIPYSETTSSESHDGNDDDNDGRANGDSDRSSFLIPPKVQRRLSLFRSKSSQETSERRKSRRNTVIGSPNLASGDGSIVRANSVSVHPVVGETPSNLGLNAAER